MYPIAEVRSAIRRDADPECQCTAQQFFADKVQVEIATACLVADIDYEILRENGSALHASTTEIQAIRASLAAGVGGYSSRSNHVIGTNLIVGYFPDERTGSMLGAEGQGLRISQFRFLSERPYKDIGNGAVLTALEERNNNSFFIRKPQDLRIAFYFLIEGFRVKDDTKTDLDIGIRLETPDGGLLAENPADSNHLLDDWRRRKIVREVGTQKFASFVGMPAKQNCATPIPYAVLLDGFAPKEVPHGKAVIRLTVTDNFAKSTTSYTRAIDVRVGE
jgi:hypothetical protein